jgi:hypothetical protein
MKNLKPNQEWEALSDLGHSSGWEALKAWMLDLPNHHYPNPELEVDSPTFLRKYSKAWGMSEAVRQAISYVDQADVVLGELRKQDENERRED